MGWSAPAAGPNGILPRREPKRVRGGQP
jgi:hypothetical protein